METLKCPQCLDEKLIRVIGKWILVCPGCDLIIPPYLEKELWPENFNHAEET